MLGKKEKERVGTETMWSSQEFALSRRIDSPDAAMIASPGFIRQLHALDKRLQPVWNFTKERWEIWCFPGQEEKQKRWNSKAYYVMTVQTKDGDYRELGADILIKLQKGDPTRYTLEQLVAYFDELDRNIQREQNRRLMERIGYLNKEWVKYAYTYSVPVPGCYNIKPSTSKVVQRAICG